MSRIICVLDACTIINIFCIDDNNDLLFRKILRILDLRIHSKVYAEVNSNFSSRTSLKGKEASVYSKIGRLTPLVIHNNVILDCCGQDYYDKVSSKSGYIKRNGEFYSIALALFISQLEDTKLTFFTDDSPAKNDFDYFYWINQIGQISDSVDLLLLLFRLDGKIKKRTILEYLDNLYSEYALSISNFLKDLRIVFSKINTETKYRKKIGLKKKLHNLIKQVDQNNFKNILEQRDQLIQERVTILSKLLSIHKDVFLLSQSYNMENFLKKIREVQKIVSANEIVRIIT